MPGRTASAEAILAEEERVILVDPDDEAIGTAAKLEAHTSGALHRAFSVFVMNRRGEILLQRRAEGKYHSAGRWSNTCCGHPRPGEKTAEAAARRLREEMGFDCDLRRLFAFTYRAAMEDGLWEHEIDHVFLGRHDADPHPDPEEVGEWRWASPRALREEMDREPDRFTPWLAPALSGLMQRLPADSSPQPRP